MRVTYMVGFGVVVDDVDRATGRVPRFFECDEGAILVRLVLRCKGSTVIARDGSPFFFVGNRHPVL